MPNVLHVMPKLICVAVLSCAAAAIPSEFEDALRAQEDGDIDSSTKLLERAADSGNPAAAYDLASRRARAGSHAKAQRLYLRAAEAGHALAMYCAAMNYRFARGTDKDLSQYVHWLRQAAERGSKDAMYSLGGAYRKALGVERDDRLWMAWWKRAADAGEGNAQFFLARLYADGKHVKKDPDEALRLFRLAAMTHSGARWALATFYERGHLVERDLDRAFRTYLSIAERGDMSAYLKVGDMYESGHGVSANRPAAFAWRSLFFARALAGNFDFRKWRAFVESLTEEERSLGDAKLVQLRMSVPKLRR